MAVAGNCEPLRGSTSSAAAVSKPACSNPGPTGAARNANYSAFAALARPGASLIVQDRQRRTPLDMPNRPERYPHMPGASGAIAHQKGILRTGVPRSKSALRKG